MIKVLLKGPILSRSGYGEHSRFMYRGLASRPDLFDIYIHPVNWGQSSWDLNLKSGKDQKDIQKCIEKMHHFKGQFDLSLQVLIPSEFENIATKNIGVTAAVETTAASAMWINLANQMDRVFVTSEHAKKTLVNPTHHVKMENDDNVYTIQMQKPVTVVSYPYRDLGVSEKAIDKIKLDTKFNFVTSAQFGPRKNLMNTIKWFVEEFKDEEDVGLVVKVHHMNNSQLDRQKMIIQLAQSVHSVPHRKCRVFLLHGNMTEDEMNSLYNHPNIHAYITATHGEGFGLPIFEAACNGMPVVAPAWSGQVDFLYDDVKNERSGRVKRTPMFTKVKYKMDKVPKEAVWEHVIDAETEWCYPDEDSFKKALRNVKNVYKPKKLVAEQLKVSLRENLDKEKMYELIVKEILEVCPEDMIELEGFFDSLEDELQVHE